MNIWMAGIDYNKATIDDREKFALTKSAQKEMLRLSRKFDGVMGCVIINTCNRMELWLSCGEGEKGNPFGILRGFFHIDEEAYRKYFTERSGGEAVTHLLELACGLKSQVFGEEQILSQVKASICFARESGAADPALEALFRSAVTAGKKAKTHVQLIAVSRSVAMTAVSLARDRLGDLKGVVCLVIGNGEMGRLAAKALVSEGCEVFMTLRQYKSGDAVIPAGCRAIDYEDRYRYLPRAKIVISATRSPHHTLQYEKTRDIVGESKKILLDLALPRDIEPEIGGLPNVTLLDIDHLGGALTDEADNGNIARVREIIGEEIAELERWDGVRSLLPMIRELSAQAETDVGARIRHRLKKTLLDENVRSDVTEAAEGAVRKVVENILFALKKNTDGEIWDACFGDAEDEPFCGTTNAESQPAEDYEILQTPRFPLFVDLSGKEIAVIGAGPIAARRVATLLKFPCGIRVTALDAGEEMARMGREGKITLNLKAYDAADIKGAFLVIAATDDRALNHRIAQDAENAGQYCSVADCREECSFYFPATVPYPGGVIGICGTGDDHAKTKEMSAFIRKLVGEKEKI